MRLLLLSLIISLLVPIFADIHSAVRSQGETFEQALKRYQKDLQANFIRISGSVSQSRKTLEEADFSIVPKWEQQIDLQLVFQQLRDLRFLISQERPDFLRRSSWLYPHDGCFARAALAGQNTARWGYKRPAKIFVFGSLEVATPNSPTKSVRWWYHVVPIVEQNQKYYVFDPAIDPKKPLLVREWLATMSRDVDSLRVTVCNPYTYVPSNPAKGADISHEARAESDQRRYLRAEWRNIERLNRNPNEELGENPPWRN